MSDAYDSSDKDDSRSSKRKKLYQKDLLYVREKIHKLLVMAPAEEGSYDDHLRRLICYLKLDVIRNAGALANESGIIGMMYSPDRENLTIAEEVIDQIYKHVLELNAKTKRR